MSSSEGKPADEAGSNKLRIMTYNVRYFAHSTRGAGSTRNGVDSIASAIATMDEPPEVICLQEVETRSLRSRFSHTPGRSVETQLDVLDGSLERRLRNHGKDVRYTGLYFPAHDYRVGKLSVYTTGLVVLVSKDLDVVSHNAEAPQDVTHRRIAAVAKWKQSRICAHVRVAKSGETVDVFNTHLSLPSFVSKRMVSREPRMGYGANQVREVEQLSSFIKARKDSERFVVVGDFNALSGSPAYERLGAETSAVDPFLPTFGIDAEQARQEWPTAGFMNLRMRIDHIFSGRGLSCLDFDDTHAFGRPGRWDGLSDHVPLVARFSF